MAPALFTQNRHVRIGVGHALAFLRLREIGGRSDLAEALELGGGVGKPLRVARTSTTEQPSAGTTPCRKRCRSFEPPVTSTRLP
jgi:hypothetical protein